MESRRSVIPMCAPGESPHALRLWAVIALDNDDVGRAVRRTYRQQALVLGRAIAGERGGVVLELDHHVTRPKLPLDGLRRAGAHDEARTVFVEDLAVLLHIGVVALRIVDVDMRDPVTLGH